MKEKESSSDSSNHHFQGKDAVGHVAYKQAQAIVDKAESHGHEMSGHISAAADAVKDVAVFGLVIAIMLHQIVLSFELQMICLAVALISWSLWKGFRGGWLSYSRLERLHRIIREEKWEIEHHREQEREELLVLYGAKGLEGALLERVVDVLMADGDRLLRIMVEEELGLRLESCEHPVKQGCYSALGGAFSTLVILSAALTSLLWAVFTASMALVWLSSFWSARQEKNDLISAVVWNTALFLVPAAAIFFLLRLLIQATTL